MIEIDGKYYVIDMDRLMAWVSETPSSEKNISTITTMSYPITNNNDEEIVEKEISESKSTLNEAMCNVRYDLVRSLINVIFSIFTNDMNQTIALSLDDMPLGQKLAFNTLYYKKIIIDINDRNNE